ncbi:hypothetical protein KIW84_035278 [Lathyrus oleraceus]|uniref:Uncharacterized protein n=1 Tax=Pisum sativum TaxID=3888 RepID=A0A9D4Y399_PEA|nr:hypothetical protein KIW84_035278 [Pisum sativum]
MKVQDLVRLFLKPIEHSDRTSSPNFEFPVFEAEEDDVEGIPDEISRLLEQEKKVTQLHLENQQNSQLGHQKKREKKKKEKKEKEEESLRPSESDRKEEINCHVSWSVISAESEKAFDKKIKPRVFRGTLCSRKSCLLYPIPGAREPPSYECPYVVKRASSGSVLTLTTMDEEVHSSCESWCSQEILRLNKKKKIKQLAKLNTPKGDLGKKERLGGLKTRKGDPGKS